MERQARVYVETGVGVGRQKLSFCNTPSRKAVLLAEGHLAFDLKPRCHPMTEEEGL